MYSSLTTARWYTRTKNSQLCNSLAQQTKEISLPNTRRLYRGNCKKFIFIVFNYMSINILFLCSISSIDYNYLIIYDQVTILSSTVFSLIIISTLIFKITKLSICFLFLTLFDKKYFCL